MIIILSEGGISVLALVQVSLLLALLSAAGTLLSEWRGAKRVKEEKKAVPVGTAAVSTSVER